MDSLNGGSQSNAACALQGRYQRCRGHRRHHHHLFYISPHCPFHRSILLPNHHLPSCTFSTTHPISQNPHLISADASSSLPDSQLNEASRYNLMVQDDVGTLEAEEEEEPIFVLTDEWRDFFAQSEAGRRQAKKEAKKKGRC